MKDYKLKLVQIIELARLAPSVHNVQPWQIQILTDGLEIKASTERFLKAGDGTGRETWISIGIFTEACQLAAASLGLCFDMLLTFAQPATVCLTINKKTPLPADVTLAAQLPKRFSDRSIFSKKPVPAEALAAIEAVGAREESDIYTSADPELLAQVAQLTKQGIAIALSSPAFRQELAEWVVPRGIKRATGIPAESLRLGVVREYLESSLLKHGISMKKEVQVEFERWQSAQAVIMILTTGDTLPAWHTAGRSYLRAVLAATAAGLHHSTSASVVEASTFHEDIEQAIGTKKRIQSIIRLGYADAKHYIPLSPRLSVDELTKTS